MFGEDFALMRELGIKHYRFSDLCEYFITINEPQCCIGLGHLNGAVLSCNGGNGEA